MVESSKNSPASSVKSVTDLVIDALASDLDYVTNQYETLWRDHESTCALLSVAVEQLRTLRLRLKDQEDQIRRLMGEHADGPRELVIPPKTPPLISMRQEGMVNADDIRWTVE